MSDTSTAWVPTLNYGDWKLSGAALQTGNELVTAVLISLFTDRLANDDDVIPDGSNDPRGWVGDLGATVPIGSRLWLLSRAKLVPAVAAQAKSLAAQALQWMVDDSVVARFDINTEIVQPNRLNMQVVAYKQDGTRVAMDFTHAWDT
jgi:phage gp46-like protein